MDRFQQRTGGSPERESRPPEGNTSAGGLDERGAANLSNMHESKTKKMTRTIALVIAVVMVFTVVAAAVLSQMA